MRAVVRPPAEDVARISRNTGLPPLIAARSVIDGDDNPWSKYFCVLVTDKHELVGAALGFPLPFTPADRPLPRYWAQLLQQATLCLPSQVRLGSRGV